MSLKIKQIEHNSTHFELIIEGILDISTRSAFDQAFQQMESIDKLEIDLKNLEFIDSTGIGGIMDIIFASQEQSFKLSINNMNLEIEEIFNTLGMFKIMESLQVERCRT
ncbi:STAS domain-containing protein [Alkalibacillus aidingensis]|uniref:STAS domain-containing protein n=1 Tax=Alkalibacillus aidingensis TaxID=2747607 RepID=UPI0016601F31|nr:STAS domain-containing protein [Alkalibacillus aidingensis]